MSKAKKKLEQLAERVNAMTKTHACDYREIIEEIEGVLQAQYNAISKAVGPDERMALLGRIAVLRILESKYREQLESMELASELYDKLKELKGESGDGE